MYYLPAVCHQKTVIVVCPLTSLMQDQVEALHHRKISACFLGSAQTDPDVRSKAFSGFYSLVYITPEFAPYFSMKEAPLLIAIDEAHCISEWGNEFRPDYSNLSILRSKFPNVPIIALTASATRAVQDDIVRKMKMQYPIKIVRDNRHPEPHGGQ